LQASAIRCGCRGGSARSRWAGACTATAWRLGYATEAGRAGLRDGFERLGLAEIVAFIHPDNARSIAVACRLGLTLRERIPHPQRPHDIDVHAAERPAAGI